MAKQLEIKLTAKARDAIAKVYAMRRHLGKMAEPVNNLRARLNRLFPTLNALGAKFASFAAYGGAAVFAGIGAGAVMAGKSVMEMGIKMEQTRVSFQTMLGSVELGNAMLAKLNKFSNWTPFTNDKVIAAGKVLMGFGMEAQHIGDVLQMVGDVAAGSGKGFTELAAIFGKTMSKGVAQAEELNQMSEAGIPVIKTLGEMYGKTAGEVRKMASEGKIGAGDVATAFRKMTSEGGLYHEMMKKQSKTAAGMWSTIVGKLQLVAAQIGEAVLPAFKAGLDMLGGWVDALRAQDVIEVMSTIAMTGLSVVGEFTKAWNHFKGFFNAMWKTLGAIGRTAMNGLLLATLGPINMMVKAAMAGINLLIDGLNKIPKIKIDPIQGNIVTEGLDIIVQSAKQELKQDTEKLLSGSTITGPADEAVRKNLEIDKKREAFHEKILKWQEKALDIQRKRAQIEGKLPDKKFMPPQLGLAKAEQEAGKAAAGGLLDGGGERTRVDSLARKGIHNVAPGGGLGANASPELSLMGRKLDLANKEMAALEKSLEIERARENLLKRMLDWRRLSMGVQERQAELARMAGAGPALQRSLAGSPGRSGGPASGAGGPERLDGERNTLLKRLTKSVEKLAGSPISVDPVEQMLT